MTTEIQNLKQTLDHLVDSSSDLNVLLEFEEVLDNLHIYAYKNWEYGEILAGPDVSRYWITVSLLYPYKLMPDPDGALRLIKHGARVFFKKDTLLEPVKITRPEDLGPTEPRSGKRKPKMKKSDVWVVTIEMPRDFVSEFESSKITINGIDINLDEVDSAYDSDNKNDMSPDKDDVMSDIDNDSQI
jgi:hypothetical protein